MKMIKLSYKELELLRKQYLEEIANSEKYFIKLIQNP